MKKKQKNAATIEMCPSISVLRSNSSGKFLCLKVKIRYFEEAVIVIKEEFSFKLNANLFQYKSLSSFPYSNLALARWFLVHGILKSCALMKRTLIFAL